MTHADNQTTPSSHYRLRIALLWGAAYGAVWSMAPGLFSKLMSSPGEAATVVIAGAITGVLVSMALAPGLASSRRWVAVCLGLLSLPLGAGLFGVVASWLHWGVMKLTGTHYRFVMQIDEPPGYVFEPLKTGRDYALYSTLSVLGLVFIPPGDHDHAAFAPPTRSLPSIATSLKHFSTSPRHRAMKSTSTSISRLCSRHSESLQSMSRREFLARHGIGFGGLGLAALFGINPFDALADDKPRGPLAPRKAHFPAKAKAVIQIYASGAPSTVDTWDPKPMLNQYDGKKIPGYGGLALGSPFKFSKQGQSGIEVSEIFPELGKLVDHLAIIRSLTAEIPDHKIATKALMTGSGILNKPSVGSWTVYGLGSENQNLPGFVTLGGDNSNRQSAFLPGIYQGCNVNYDPRLPLTEIINNISNVFSPAERQRHQLDFARELNEMHAAQLQRDAQLEARIQSFEIAFNMQREALDAFDVTKEPQAMRDRYELLPDRQRNANGTKMLIARRLVERGVRFVQVTTGGWDTHFDLAKAVRGAATNTDRAAAALLSDLKERGLLDSTLVIWGGEFGRTPTAQPTTGLPGRDHNGKSMMAWMAGGGVKGGTIVGETDDFGGRSVEKVADIHDLHATILSLLGFDHERLTYNYNGRDFRLTDVSGKVIKDVIA